MKHMKVNFCAWMVLCAAAISVNAMAENLLHKADVRVMGPGGEILVYYKDGADIVVRNCGKDYPKVEQRSDCRGTENRIPDGVFKQVLRSEFLVGNADKLKPMTKDELEAYRSADMSGLEKLQAQEKELDTKLARIKEFLDQGAGDQAKQDQAATEKLLAEVRAQLAKGKANGAAVKKVNDLINEIINKIADSKTLHKVADGKDGDQAIFNLLRQFDASKGQCGTDAILGGSQDYNPGDDNQVPGGVRKATWLINLMIPEAKAAGYTTEERIKNCVSLPGAIKKTVAGATWNLVSRSRDPKTGKFYEVWKDAKRDLLWGDRLDNKYTHYNAVALDSNGKVISESACKSEEGQKASAGIGEKKFGLPTIEEFQDAEKNGVREVLPNMKDYFFWSASLDPDGTDYARGFYGSGGDSDVDDRDYDYSVRCIGR